jgi:ketosteroid isomerase-like protein
VTAGASGSELVSLYLAAVCSGDATVVDRFFHPEIEYVVNGTTIRGAAETLPVISEESHNALPWLGVHRGREAVKRFLAHMHANLRVTAFGTRAILGTADRVAAFGWFRLHAPATGRTVDIPFAIWIELLDGMIVKYHFLENTLDVALAFRGRGEWQLLTDGAQHTVPSAQSEART